MTYKEFAEYIEELRKNEEYINKLADLNVNVFEELTLETMVVELLAKAIGDKYEWLSWWIWEKEYGTRKELDAFEKDANGNDIVIPTDTPRDIWNLIQRNVEEEKKNAGCN